MYNNRAIEVVGVLHIQTCVVCYLKSKKKKTDTSKREQNKFSLLKGTLG